MLFGSILHIRDNCKKLVRAAGKERTVSTLEIFTCKVEVEVICDTACGGIKSHVPLVPTHEMHCIWL